MIAPTRALIAGRLAAFAVVCAAWAAPTSAAAALPAIKLVSVGSFTAPVAVAQPPGSATDLWVVQKGGQIIVMRNGVRLAAKALDLTGAVSRDVEQGLLGLAFPPDFQSSHLAYVTYTDRSNAIVLAEYSESGSILTPSSARVVMRFPKGRLDHNGGTIRFGPDGFLYLGLGDGGTGPSGNPGDPDNNAQRLDSPFGKILRIDPRRSGELPYTVPVDNPFALTAGAMPEVWAMGLRNPWKFSFAPDGAMWIGDVGLEAMEEVDRAAAAGLNFGWSPWEGTKVRRPAIPSEGFTLPAYAYHHGRTTGCAVTGGVVVADAKLPSTIRGRYLYADFCAGKLIAIQRWSSGRYTVIPTGVNVPGSAVTSFDTDASGRVYISSLAGGVWLVAKR